MTPALLEPDTAAATTSNEAGRGSRVLLANAAIVVAWLALHVPALRWIASHAIASPLHAGLFVVTAALLARGLAPPRALLEAFEAPPRAAIAPLALLAVAAIGTVIADRLLDVSILAAALFALGSYGLAGLFMSPARFRRARPAALLFVALLPFGDQADTYVGFSARVATARAVHALLAPIVHGAPPTETILVLEAGAAHVDVPCSGVRSLASGLVFFLAATCILGRRAGLRWVVTGVAYAALLLAANVVRVTAVVLLARGVDLPSVAEIVHAPIGVLGFAAASAIAIAMLRGWCMADPPASRSHDERRFRGPRASLVIAFSLAALSLLHVRRAAAVAPPAAPRLSLPSALAAEPLPLTTAEIDLFRRWGGAADKRRFRVNGLEGALLVVVSNTFRAHHAPEVCLAGSGVRTDGLHDVALEDGATIRGGLADGGHRTALYWFQSRARITPDLASRIWDDVSGRERRWAQVSLLIDAPIAITSPEGRALVDAVRAAVASMLAEEDR